MISNSNPYNEYFDCLPEDFVGRRDEIWKIMNVLARPSGQAHLEIKGLPETGKSRLISYIKYLLTPEKSPSLKKRDWQTKIAEKYTALNCNSMFVVQVSFSQIPFGMHPFQYLYNRFHETYKDYLSFERLIKHQYPIIDYQEKFRSVDEIIRKLGSEISILNERLIYSVLLLDDFDKIFANQIVSKQEVNLLRSIRDQVAIILFTEKSLSKVNPDASSSPFFQSMPAESLSSLSEDEARKFLLTPVNKKNLALPENDVDYVLSITNGFPYLLILAGTALWDMRSSLKILENNNIPLSQVYKDALAGQLYDQFIRSFSIYWEHLEPNEHSAIKELATFSKQKGQKTLDSPGVIDVFPPLKSKGIFKGELAGHISLFSPLFEKYVDTGTSLAKSREIPINNEIALTKIEQDLLNYLQENKGRACTYEELFANVWEHRSKSRHAIQITISRLRSKLKSSNGGQIQNESGKGYTFYQ